MRDKALLSALVLALAGGGCSSHPLAYGDPNSIIAVMEPALWEDVQDDVYSSLEPTVQTVRDEKRFTVTYQDPSRPEWGNLRRFRQLLLVGTADEPWIQQALEEARTPLEGPGLTRAYDVWARGQQVTIVVLSRADAGDELRALLPQIAKILDDEYRQYAVNKMFITGADSALADTLFVQGRFRLLVPKVYTWERKADSVFVFRNDNPDPSELIRQVAVTWRSPIPVGLQPEDLLDWRASLTRDYYGEPQDQDLTDRVAGPFEYRGRDAYEIRAVWANPPELGWPAGGPFILRAIICPEQDRMYLLDAWLYAPSREKYEYIIQLETILDSFRCGPA